MHKSIWRYILPAAVCAVLCYFLFAMPTVCAAGVQHGLSVCGSVILPALFPFMVVSAFLLRSGISEFFGRFAAPLTRCVFRLPGESAGVILLALVGGFPVGAKMTALLLREGRITPKEAKRMCLFCINAGPAFMVTAVGTTLLHSSRAGAILYASTCLATLLLGVATRVLGEKMPPARTGVYALRLTPPLEAMAEAVRSATASMLQICAWVVLFSAVHACLYTRRLPEGAKLLLSCLLEVSSGIEAAAGHLSLPALAAVLSFGGISVHCQILADLQDCGLPLRHFLAGRGVCAAFSACICTGLLQLFPCEVSVFATTSGVIPAAYSVSIPSFAALIVMCALLILEVEPNRKVC